MLSFVNSIKDKKKFFFLNILNHIETKYEKEKQLYVEI